MEITQERERYVWRLLYFGFIALPVLAGLDKFFHILTEWSVYLSPKLIDILPFGADSAMRLVGIIEIAAGIIVAIKPRIGGFIVSFWLLAIILNLLSFPGYYDIALRDFGLSLSAASLALLSRKEDKP